MDLQQQDLEPQCQEAHEFEEQKREINQQDDVETRSAHDIFEKAPIHPEHNRNKSALNYQTADA